MFTEGDNKIKIKYEYKNRDNKKKCKKDFLLKLL